MHKAITHIRLREVKSIDEKKKLVFFAGNELVSSQEIAIRQKNARGRGNEACFSFGHKTSIPIKGKKRKQERFEEKVSPPLKRAPS